MVQVLPDPNVPEHIRGVLLELVYGWTPSVVPVGSVREIRYNGVDLAGFKPELRLTDGRLQAKFSGARVRVEALDLIALGGVLEGRLDDGSVFRGHMVEHVTKAVAVSEAVGASLSVTLEAAQWEIVNGTTPSLWVGRLRGAPAMVGGGNLTIERVAKDGYRAGQRQHIFLSGTYAYYVVQVGDRDQPACYLVVDTGADVLDGDVLGREFLTLQFVLGRQLHVAELQGMSPARDVVAARSGCGNRPDLATTAFPPVPMERSNEAWVDECWTAVLFERLCAYWRCTPKVHLALWMALDGYLTAMTWHIDSDYLRLQVVLEAFAYWLLRASQETERMVVTDKKAWKRWVQAHESEIRDLAAQGFADSLYNKVVSVYRLSSGRVVPSAFLLYELPINAEMTAELEGRDEVVHQGMMSPNGYDLPRDVRRVALVRTMLVSLLALASDYRGAINGWEVGPLGLPREPNGWWVVRPDDLTKAERRYYAHQLLDAERQ